MRSFPAIVLWTLLLGTAAPAADRVREVRLAEGTPFETTAIVRTASRKGPVVVVVGGIHGNESAGWRAAEQIRHWTIARGVLVVIPRANRLGIAAFRRTVPEGKGYDLNRRFPSAADGPITGALPGSIWRLLAGRHPDWVIDLHESVDYRSTSTEKRKHLGNTLIVHPSEEGLRMAALMAQAANAPAPKRAHRWVVLKWPIEGSLARAAAERLGARAMIVETTRKEHLALRVQRHRVVVHRCLRELGLLSEDVSAHRLLPSARRAGEIRVALYNSLGTGLSSARQVERCLPKDGSVVARRITATAIRAGALEDFDVVVFPGGTGSGTAKTLQAAGREKVRTFVSRGGGYLGICAGAYLGTRHYRWSLGIVDAKVLDTAHWARGKGRVTIRLTDAGRRLLAGKSRAPSILYAQGPILAPGGDANIPDFETLAVFVGEVAKRGAPRGVMPGTPAAVRGRFGKGRAVLFSPHPEQTTGLRGYVPRVVRWLAGDR